METNEYLLRLIQITKDMEALDLFADCGKLSKTEFRLIREIVKEREQGRNIISSELARRLGITRSAVSQIVTRLEQQGVVTRTPSAVDRKIAYICFSERSLAVFDQQCREANDIMDRVIGELGEDKMKLLIQTYDEFRAALAKVRAQDKKA